MDTGPRISAATTSAATTSATARADGHHVCAHCQRPLFVLERGACYVCLGEAQVRFREWRRLGDIDLKLFTPKPMLPRPA